jgi:hypothetical protein
MILKASELRVDNIIENGFRKLNGFQDNLEKVTMLNAFGEINVFSCPIDRDYSGSGCQMPFGVKVDEQWMLKFKQTKTDGNIDCYIKVNDNLIILFTSFGKCELQMNGEVLKVIEFIHQLQNIYFNFNNEELELK